MKTPTRRCEECLRAVTDAHCARHPYATVLDPSDPADARWLEALNEVKGQRRLRMLDILLMATLTYLLFWSPDWVFWVVSGGGASVFWYLQRSKAPVDVSELLPEDPEESWTSEEAEQVQKRRRERQSRTSERRPNSSRLHIAG